MNIAHQGLLQVKPVVEAIGLQHVADAAIEALNPLPGSAFRFHPNQVMTDLPDGSLLVEFSASGWVEMAWHLVSWGRAVEVLNPPELRFILERVRRGDVEVLP
jgi:hypothetical protein